ncbi:MAG: hypothetical protein JWM27_446 [Gemmatimonadetes bacterium]|nr:hypothetical protein [Gemmatimonadota bacterium]
MSNWRFRGAVRTAAAVAACALAAACSEHTDAPMAPSTAAKPSMVREQESVDELTQMVARALRDPALRQRVFEDLRASRFSREHKLDFRAYLRGQGGGAMLLERLAAEKPGMPAGARPTDVGAAVLNMVGSIRRLEFYMPVPEHRAAWTGGPDLIVASQIAKNATPVGYRLDGTPVALTNDAPPATPVLVLVTQENSFKSPLPVQFANADDNGGRALGTLARPGETNIRSRARFADGSLIGGPRGMIAADPGCDPTTAIVECPTDGGGGGGYTPPPSYPAGVYLDATHMVDLKEPWSRGDAEVEVFVVGPTYNPTSQGEIISCSGQGASGVKHFDQNANDWTHSSWGVEGQLLSKAEVSQYYTVYAAPFSLQMWEDDDTACEIVFSDRSQLNQLFDNLRAAQRATTLIMQVLTSHILINPATGNAIRNSVGAMFQSDDDFLGNVVYRPNSSRTDSYGDTFVDADVIGSNMASDGWITIRTSDTDHAH